MIPAGPLFHKPKSILAARNILFASLFLAILVFILRQFILFQHLQLNMLVLISNGALLVLLYVAIHYIGFGKKWARTLFLILFIVNIISSVRYVPFILKANIVLGFLIILQMLLQIIALVYLYSKNSRDWFNSFDNVDR
jgi:hypothetical protein